MCHFIQDYSVNCIPQQKVAMCKCSLSRPPGLQRMFLQGNKKKGKKMHQLTLTLHTALYIAEPKNCGKTPIHVT